LSKHISLSPTYFGELQIAHHLHVRIRENLDRLFIMPTLIGPATGIMVYMHYRPMPTKMLQNRI